MMARAVRVAERPAPQPVDRRQPIAVWDLICWAFQRECAGLDFNEMQSTAGERPNVDTIYRMMQRGALGCQVDGGGRSSSHPDADVVASVLAALPIGCGGRSMAIWIAGLARVGRAPDWMASPVPRCEPIGWKHTRHGRFAERIYWTSAGRWPAPWLGRDDGYACPVVYTDTARDVAAARRDYKLWWLALLEVRCALASTGALSAFRLTEAMPPKQPWKEKG